MIPRTGYKIAAHEKKSVEKDNDQSNMAENINSSTNQISREPCIINFGFENSMKIETCICTRQDIPTAYYWTQVCPFRQNDLLQTSFSWDSSLTTTTAPQCTGNLVDTSQIPNQRQRPSTEASSPAY
ncbi:hypothetical protein TNCV_2370931 [Trichonephila clavipes]|nr:hypothetical protein TNCV_2370931 [Trichonephila clavipes]